MLPELVVKKKKKEKKKGISKKNEIDPGRKLERQPHNFQSAKL